MQKREEGTHEQQMVSLPPQKDLSCLCGGECDSSIDADVSFLHHEKSDLHTFIVSDRCGSGGLIGRDGHHRENGILSELQEHFLLSHGIAYL